jgi:hypothetical protein
MNIKGKIKKLEDKLNVNSEFCTCFSYKGKVFPHTEFYHQDLSVDSADTTPILQGEGVPDICEKCGKSVEKKQIIIQFIDASSKENFPELFEK